MDAHTPAATQALSFGAGARLEIRGVVDAAAEKLRESVLQGDLSPGTVVTEALVSQTFNIARPSAKAAIEKLAAEGLLERTAHRSARVLTTDVATVRDIYQTRRRLEGAALRDLAALRLAPEPAEIANLRVIELSTHHPSEIIEHDLGFHLALIDALSSPRLSLLYRRILTEVQLCMAQVQGRKLLASNLIGDEHAQILDALKQGDAELAVALLTTHLGRAEELLTKAIEHDARH